MVEINRDKVNIKEKQISLKNVEEEKSEIFNGSCDEFTHTEMIKRCEPYLSNQIPFSNYEIKINENKKEIKKMVEMPKDEFLKAFGGIEMVGYDIKMRNAMETLKN